MSEGGTLHRKSPLSTISQRYLTSNGPPLSGLTCPASTHRRTHGARTKQGREDHQSFRGIGKTRGQWASRDCVGPGGQEATLFPLSTASYSDPLMTTSSMSSEGPDVYLLSLTRGDLPVFEICTAANHTTLDYFLMVVLRGSQLKACVHIFVVNVISNVRH